MDPVPEIHREPGTGESVASQLLIQSPLKVLRPGRDRRREYDEEMCRRNPVIRGSGHRRGLPPICLRKSTVVLCYLRSTDVTRDQYWVPSDVQGWPPAGKHQHQHLHQLHQLQLHQLQLPKLIYSSITKKGYEIELYIIAYIIKKIICPFKFFPSAA